MKSGRRGFTLPEIMIVIAVIALIVALAIPNLLRSRHNANEAAAIEAVRTFSTALESFRPAQTPPTYPVSLAALGVAGPLGPAYIPASLANSSSPATARQGYYYPYQRLSADRYTLQGVPAAVGTTGTRYFFVDETGLIHVNDGAPAGPASPELQ